MNPDVANDAQHFECESELIEHWRQDCLDNDLI